MIDTETILTDVLAADGIAAALAPADTPHGIITSDLRAALLRLLPHASALTAAAVDPPLAAVFTPDADNPESLTFSPQCGKDMPPEAFDSLRLPLRTATVHHLLHLAFLGYNPGRASIHLQTAGALTASAAAALHSQSYPRPFPRLPTDPL